MNRIYSKFKFEDILNLKNIYIKVDQHYKNKLKRKLIVPTSFRSFDDTKNFYFCISTKFGRFY